MSGSNLRESLKNQFRGAYGSRMHEEREHVGVSVPDPDIAKPSTEVQVSPIMQPPAASQSIDSAHSPVVAQSSVISHEPTTNHNGEKKESVDMEVEKGHSTVSQLPCGITDFLNATPEEQLCYSLGEQMAAILKYLLQLPKPWVNLTYADIRNDAGEPVPAESRRTMVGILQKKGFIKERRRADIGIYKGITFVLDPDLANTFCRLNRLETPAWLYDVKVHKKQPAKPRKKASRTVETSKAYDDLIIQNKKLQEEIQKLKELLVLKSNNGD